MLISDCQQELNELLAPHRGHPPKSGSLGGGYEIIKHEPTMIVVRGPLGSLWGFSPVDLANGEAQAYPVEAFATVGYRRAQ